MERTQEELDELADMDFATTIAITKRKSGGFVISNQQGAFKVGERLTLGEVLGRLCTELVKL